MATAADQAGDYDNGLDASSDYRGIIRSARSPRPAKTTADIVVAVVLPWLVFLLIATLFQYVYQSVPVLVWILSACFAVLAALFVVLGLAVQKGTLLAAGILTWASVFAATWLGLWLQGQYLSHYWALTAGREYRHVSPEAGVQNTSNAAVIHFVEGTLVDDRRTVGFVAEGRLFCVAPVSIAPKSIDDQILSSVAYWAVGKDCCEMRSNFDCGTSRDIRAKSAIVERPSISFKRAIAQAESVHDIRSSSDGAQLVSFVSNPEDAIRNIWDESQTLMILALTVDLLFLAAAGILLAQVLLPAKSPESLSYAKAA